MPISKLVRLSRSVVEPVSYWSSMVGAIALVATMLLIGIDVALRSTLRVTFPATIEVVQISLVIIFFSGMAYTQIAKKHVRVDILISRFSHGARLVTTLCADLMTMGIVCIISWQSVVQAQFAQSSSYVTGILRIPMWPLGILISVFMALLGLAVLIDFLEHLDALRASGGKNYLWLACGTIVTLMLLSMFVRPNMFLPIDIAPQTLGIIALLLLFALIFLFVHIGAAMAVIALWVTGYLSSPGAGLALLGMVSQSVAANYTWSVVPLFVCMGLLVAGAGFSRDLYSTAHKWLGRMPGGLASATVGACSAFAAVVGDTLSGVATMSVVALPQMRAYKYDDKLATASIAAGSTIGALIPPSIPFIVYGIMVEESIGKLFIAGLLPGILMAGSLILMISVRCRIDPQLGPAGSSTTLREKVISLTGSWPVLALFLLVLGGIYLGFFTANEAGAIGALGSLVIGLSMRRIPLKKFFEAAIGAVQLSSMLFFIFIYAIAITQAFAVTRLPFALANLTAGLAAPRYVTLALILFMYLILGCIINALPGIILTLPLVFPTVVALGFDPIWFGVLIVIMAQIGTITPPIGLNVFAMAGLCDVPMYRIFRGVTPFWIIMLGEVAILIAFPEIALFLPNLMIGG